MNDILQLIRSGRNLDAMQGLVRTCFERRRAVSRRSWREYTIHKARDHVVATAWRERDDDAHRLAGPGILGRDAGCGAEQGQAERCQRQKRLRFASLHVDVLRRARQQLLL